MLANAQHIFGFQNVAPVVSQKVAAEGGAVLSKAVGAVNAKLTVDAMRAMDKAVAIDKRSPAAVAGRSSSKANGLA